VRQKYLLSKARFYKNMGSGKGAGAILSGKRIKKNGLTNHEPRTKKMRVQKN
jgi:hypothetical protein